VPKIPGIPHLEAVRALEKAGFRVVREGKHIVMSDGRRILTTLVTIPSTHSPWAVSLKMLASPLRNFGRSVRTSDHG
jgi:predicted RNA binding protein YcfA (HicA-like mRNA interferase family)